MNLIEVLIPKELLPLNYNNQRIFFKSDTVKEFTAR